MGIFDWKHWIVLLVVVVLVFGTKKLKNFGSDLGESIKGFRKAMNDEEHKPAEQTRRLPSLCRQCRTPPSHSQATPSRARHSRSKSHSGKTDPCSASVSASCCSSAWSPCWCSAPSARRRPHRRFVDRAAQAQLQQHQDGSGA